VRARRTDVTRIFGHRRKTSQESDVNSKIGSFSLIEKSKELCVLILSVTINNTNLHGSSAQPKLLAKRKRRRKAKSKILPTTTAAAEAAKHEHQAFANHIIIEVDEYEAFSIRYLRVDIFRALGLWYKAVILTVCNVMYFICKHAQFLYQCRQQHEFSATSHGGLARN